MSRWEPDAPGRLQAAAFELYTERGYDQTTVAEIAARAGLTERTFFRYFADKREVLFWGAAALEAYLVRHVDEAPDGLAPLEVVSLALCSAADDFFDDRREFALRRQQVIAANPELHERELIKLANLASAVAEALRRRGVTETAATLAAEAGVAVFKVGFEQWARGSGAQTLAEQLRSSFGDLRSVAGG